MVRFHDQHIAAAQVVANADRKIAQLGGNAALDAIGAEVESAGVSRVVRNGEGLYRNVAYLEAAAGFEFFQPFELWALAALIADGSRPGLVSRPRHEDWDTQLLGQRGQAVDVVGMLVRDQNG